LQVIDVSNPANPQRVGGYANFFARAVVVSANYAYLVNNVFVRLVVVDVSNPANPVRVGLDDTGAGAYAVAVSGNYAYVGAMEAGLQVIDVSSPANPKRLGGYDTSGYALGVAVSGNYAYVADREAGLQVIDVSNPADPLRVGGYGTTGYALDIAVSGNYDYVANSDAGLLVFSLAQTGTPPIITVPPTSQTVTEGSSVTFEVTVSGTGPFLYQWQRNNTNLPGMTNSSFAIGVVKLSDAGELPGSGDGASWFNELSGGDIDRECILRAVARRFNWLLAR
jgi:hypothetical protein